MRGMFLVPSLASFKGMLWKDFEVSFPGILLVPPLVCLKGILQRDFEVPLPGMFLEPWWVSLKGNLWRISWEDFEVSLREITSLPPGILCNPCCGMMFWFRCGELSWSPLGIH